MSDDKIPIALAQPDLLALDGAPVCAYEPDGSCSICGDAGVEGRVVALRPGNMALVVTDAGEQEVAIDLVDAPRPGDVLLIHLGFAIGRVDDAG